MATIERALLSTLSQDPANVRKHNTRNIEAIAASLRAFGQQTPIVVDSRSIILKGNGTYEAAKSLGWDHIDIIRTQLSGPEAMAYAIADNRTGELAEWDLKGLGQQVGSLLDFGINLDAIGWKDFEVEPLLRSDWSPTDSDWTHDDIEKDKKEGSGDSRDSGESPSRRSDDPSGMNRPSPPIGATVEAREVFNEAIALTRDLSEDISLTESDCLTLICQFYLDNAGKATN